MSVFSISSLTTKNGVRIDLPPVGVLCVVGGNNVGKSQFLRDIPARVQGMSTNQPTVLIEEVNYNLTLDNATAIPWLLANSIEVVSQGQPTYYQASGGGIQVNPSDFRSWITQQPGPELSSIMDWFIRSLDAAARSSVATEQIGSGSILENSSALHALFREGELESELSALCKKSFGFPLTLDRPNGNVMLRVGEPTIPSPSLQNPTREYSDEVRRLTPLYQQGDGVKNYLGMVLHIMTGVESVTIFDEPEAFLHPAQARALGRHLGREVHRRERQLITATHDRDFLLGLLESQTALTIVRINRDGDANTFTSIDSEIISAIWAKPALRYSNLLQGLFHRTVVLCEGDADCQWYSAVTDIVGEAAQMSTEEILFVPGGGKDQVPISLAALNALKVSVFTITDFDSLLKPDFIKAMLDAKAITDDELINKVRRLKRVLVHDGKERQAKDFGLNGLPPGDATQLATDIVARLRKYNLLIVPTGELESFDRAIGGHGPAWVSAALNKGSHQTSEEAKSLVRSITNSLSTQTPIDLN